MKTNAEMLKTEMLKTEMLKLFRGVRLCRRPAAATPLLLRLALCAQPRSMLLLAFQLFSLSAFSLLAQPAAPQPRPATQAEVNAGVLTRPYVSPATLNGWLGTTINPTIVFTNALGVISSVTNMSQMQVTNLLAAGHSDFQGPQVLLTKSITLSLGTNTIPAWSNAVVVLISPTNDATQVTLQLAGGTNTVQLLKIINNGGAFTLPDGSTNTVGGIVNLNNHVSWVSTNSGESLNLFFNSPNWNEDSRTSTNGFTGGVVINSTNGRIPVRGSSTTFTDSPLAVVNSTTTSNLGPFYAESFGLTNGYRITNSSPASSRLDVVGPSTTGTMTIGGSAGTLAFTGGLDGTIVAIGDLNVVQNGYTWNFKGTGLNAYFAPATSNAADIGTALLPIRTNFIGNLRFMDGTVQSTAATSGSGIATSSGIGTNTTLKGVTLYGDTAATNAFYFTAAGSLHSNGVGQVSIGSGRFTLTNNVSFLTNGNFAPVFDVSLTNKYSAAAVTNFTWKTYDTAIAANSVYFEFLQGSAGNNVLLSGNMGGGASPYLYGPSKNSSIGATWMSIGNGVQLGWSASGAASSTLDAFFMRDAAATVQMGADAASVVTPQTFKAADGSGTDKAGAQLDIKGGQGTGTGIGGALGRFTSLTGSTGSSANSYSTREYIYAGETTLTESSATSVVKLSLAAGKYIGVSIFATTHSDDGTDFNVTTDDFTVSAVAKSTTITSAVSTVAASSTAASSASTLTTAWTVTDNGDNTFTIKNNAISSLTQTTLKTKYQIRVNGDGIATVTTF